MYTGVSLDIMPLNTDCWVILEVVRYVYLESEPKEADVGKRVLFVSWLVECHLFTTYAILVCFDSAMISPKYTTTCSIFYQIWC